MIENATNRENALAWQHRWLTPMIHARNRTRVVFIAWVTVVLAVIGFSFGRAPSTAAQSSNPVRYTLSGVTFIDGTMAQGSFVFDPDASCVIPNCGAFSAVAITTLEWGSATGGGCDVEHAVEERYGSIINASAPSRLATRGTNPLPLELWLEFTATLGATGSISIDTGGSSSEFSGAGCNRIVTGGEVVGELVNSTTTSATTTDPSATTTGPTTTTPASGLPGNLPETGTTPMWLALVACLLVAFGFVARRSASR